jgi:uncharacterized membrane protein YbaN (DUF454 family)
VRRIIVLVVGVLSLVWNIIGCFLALHRHSSFFAAAFGVLLLLSVITISRAVKRFF